MSDNPADQTLKCRDCPADFVFTAGEQEFYREHNYQPPKRCKSCRDARKARNSNNDPGFSPAPPRQDWEELPRQRRKGGRRDNYND